MNDTATKMRELLARWAEVEPGRCLLEKTENIIQGGPTLEECYVIDAEKLWKVVFDDVIGIPLDDSRLMRIQWAVQQAIVARGWYFNLEYFPTHNQFMANVDNLRSELSNSSAEALLSAYLRNLEVTK